MAARDVVVVVVVEWVDSKCGVCRCIEKDEVDEMDRREAAVAAAVDDILMLLQSSFSLGFSAWLLLAFLHLN